MEGLIEGRIVHYVDEQVRHRAAVITKVWNDNGIVNLFVFPDASYGQEKISHTSIEFSNSGLDEGSALVNTWHWIEKA